MSVLQSLIQENMVQHCTNHLTTLTKIEGDELVKKCVLCGEVVSKRPIQYDEIHGFISDKIIYKTFKDWQACGYRVKRGSKSTFRENDEYYFSIASVEPRKLDGKIMLTDVEQIIKYYEQEKI